MCAKVLVVCEYATLNGGERSFLSVLPHLVADGFDVTVAAPAAGDFANELNRADVAHLPFELYDSVGKRKEIDDLRNQIDDLMEQSGAQIVHANSLSMSRLVGPVAMNRNVPSIGHLRDIIKISRRVINDINCNSRILAVSHATRDWHVGAGMEHDKTHVVYNGVDLDVFQPRTPTGAIHKSLGIDPSIRFLVSIGQIGLRKGLDTLLAGAVDFVSDDTHVLVVGQRFSEKEESIEYERRLHDLANAPPLAGRVHFLGWHSDIAALLNETAVLIHCARQEPLGRVLLEAAASGVPVVATEVGGTREIFPTECEAAKLFAVDDSKELSRAVKQILETPKLAEQMSNAGRDRATQAFDARQSAESISKHYQDVVSNRSGRP